MARYIVTHHSVTQANQDQLIEAAKQIAASLPSGTEWLNSWWVADTEKLICEWEAPNADVIQACLEPATALFPIGTIYEAQWIDPSWYK